MAGQNIESYLKLYGIELFQTPEWLGWINILKKFSKTLLKVPVALQF